MNSIYRFGMPMFFKSSILLPQSQIAFVLLLAAFVFLLLAAWKPRVVRNGLNDLPSKASFSIVLQHAFSCQATSMAAQLDGILDLAKACAGIPDPVGWIKTLECALRVSCDSSKLDESVTQIWHSPRLAAEEVHMVVAVEWTMYKLKRGFGIAFIMGIYQKMAFQGEFYLIQADNESGLAKTIIREVQNVESLRSLYHDGIQVHTGAELEKYLEEMLQGRA